MNAKKLFTIFLFFKKYFFNYYIILFLIFVSSTIFVDNYTRYLIVYSEESNYLFDKQATEEWFPDGIQADNINGFSEFIVPNIIHYILIGKNEIGFGHFISIKSVVRNQKPDKILIHCDCEELGGKYWRKLNEEEKRRVIIKKLTIPKTIFGQYYDSGHYKWHVTDVLRIQILMSYGGIYLDNDVYVIKSFDKFRKFEMTVGFSNEDILGNQVLVAHKNARFLKLYLLSYQNYVGWDWYYNAGVNPTKNIINKYPHLVNRVNDSFGITGRKFCPLLYQQNIKTWQFEYYAIHLLIRDNSINHSFWCFNQSLPFPKITDFDEFNVKSLENTFGQMARLVLYDTI